VCQTGQEIVQAFGLPIEDQAKLANFDKITNYLRVDPALSAAFASNNAQFITNYSKREALPVVHPDTDIKHLFRVLSTSHRAAVLDNQKLVNYITQSDCVEYIHKHNLLGPLASKTIQSLQLASKSVVTFKHTEPVVEAFKKMFTEKVSGVGVVDEKEKLIGCISAHDIRAITGSGELLEHLYQPYDAYKKLMETLKVATKAQIIKASADATLGEVVETMVKEKVHRVFITDEANNATGVITLGDILKCVAE